MICQMRFIAGRTIHYIFADSNPLPQYLEALIRFTERLLTRKQPSFSKVALSNLGKPTLLKMLKLLTGKKLHLQVKLYPLCHPGIETIYSLILVNIARP